VAVEEFPLQLPRTPSGVPKAKVHLRSVVVSDGVMEELQVASEIYSIAYLQGLVGDRLGRVKQHHLVGLDGASRPDIDMGIDDALGIEDLFGKLYVEALIDDQPKRPIEVVLAYQYDTAGKHTHIDLWGSDEHRSLLYL
jgi:hypothetical protein